MSAEKPSDPAYDSTLRQRNGQATEPVSEPPATEPRGFFDSRTGYRQLLRHLLDEPVRGGASFAYVFGSLLLFVLCNQALTGVLLMAFYAPSATDAWASVAYIQDQVQLGWFIRGMHSAGASVMMLGMCAHMLQVLIYGAYKKPRELNWLSGLFLVTLVFGFALTGYLLPWDQKGYWATQVATTLIGSIPLCGSLLQQLLQGGPTYGNLTLTHFYALHVFVYR
jgi:ubiquinol-cytochrome c reductase cytochrome b subunit